MVWVVWVGAQRPCHMFLLIRARGPDPGGCGPHAAPSQSALWAPGRGLWPPIRGAWGLWPPPPDFRRGASATGVRRSRLQDYEYTGDSNSRISIVNEFHVPLWPTPEHTYLQNRYLTFIHP